MYRKPHLAFLLGFTMAAILSVGMLGLGVLASAKLDVQAQPVSGSDFDAFPIEAPAEPTVPPGRIQT